MSDKLQQAVEAVLRVPAVVTAPDLVAEQAAQARRDRRNERRRERRRRRATRPAGDTAPKVVPLAAAVAFGPPRPPVLVVCAGCRQVVELPEGQFWCDPCSARPIVCVCCELALPVEQLRSGEVACSSCWGFHFHESGPELSAEEGIAAALESEAVLGVRGLYAVERVVWPVGVPRVEWLG